LREAPEFAVAGRVGNPIECPCAEAPEYVIAGQFGVGRGDVAELTGWPCEGARRLGIPGRVGNRQCGVDDMIEGPCAEAPGFAVARGPDARRDGVPGRDGVIEREGMPGRDKAPCAGATVFIFAEGVDAGGDGVAE